MRLTDYVSLAVRNLTRRRVRTLLTVTAVVIGAVSVVMMLSLALGARHAFVSQMEALGHLDLITVVSGPDGSRIDDDVLTQLRNIAGVTGVSPAAYVGGNLQTMELQGGGKISGVQLDAYEPGTGHDPPLIAGRSLRPDDVARIVTNQAVLKAMGYEGSPAAVIGRTVRLVTRPGYTGWGADVSPPPQGDSDTYWKEIEQRVTLIEAEIIGVMASGPTQESATLTNLAWGRELNSWREWRRDDDESRRQGIDVWTTHLESEINLRGYHAVLVRVDQIGNVSSVAGEIERLGLGVRTAQDILDNLTTATGILSVILGSIGAVSLGVAMIGIVNTMVMATYERTREIGVMRACGATKGTIRGLFAFEATMLGFSGGVFGLGMCFVLRLAGNYLLNRFAEEYGAMARDVISFPLWLIAGVIAFTTVIGLIAGIYPAVNAARLNPVEALRHE